MSESNLIVEGMTCSHCVAHVTKALQALPGVSKVEVELKTGRAVMTHADPLATDVVQRAVEEAGYRIAKT